VEKVRWIGDKMKSKHRDYKGIGKWAIEKEMRKDIDIKKG